ncbi:NAD(P)H-dependent oxidoreductase, partial [Streptomyces alboverticillatus]
MSVRILALVGSLRAGSHNRQLAEAAVKLAPAGAEIVLYEGLGDIPFYNEDIDVEGSVPAAAAKLREAAGTADAFLLFSPEYNGTIPAVLKNAIDWLSRPYGAGALAGKPVAVIGTAFGQYGGVWAQDEARKAAGIAGGKVVEDIKLSIPHSVTRFAETHPV